MYVTVMLYVLVGGTGIHVGIECCWDSWRKGFDGESLRYEAYTPVW